MSIAKRPLGATGLMVSEIGFGALEIGRDWAPDVNVNCSHCTFEEASQTLNGILDLGINFIDTAPAYWDSEDFIGRAISHRRDEFILATKVGENCDRNGSVYDYSYEATLRFVDNSLKRLQTDRIDLLQIHSASMEVLEKGDTLRAMQEAKKAGKVLHLGMTGGVAECTKALKIGGYETVQVPYNLINTHAEDKLFPLAAEKNAGVIIMRGLAGGKLTAKHTALEDENVRNAIKGFVPFQADENSGDPIAALAIQYILARREVSSVILGTRHLERAEANLELAKGTLSPDVLQKVRDYSRSLEVRAW